MLFLALLFSFLVFCPSGFFLFICNFSVLDLVLPFDEIDQLFLFPILILFLMEGIPDLWVFFFDLLDVSFQFIQTLLFAFFPSFVLFIVSFFLFSLFVLLGVSFFLDTCNFFFLWLELSVKCVVFFIKRGFFFLDRLNLLIEFFFQIQSLF